MHGKYIGKIDPLPQDPCSFHQTEVVVYAHALCLLILELVISKEMNRILFQQGGNMKDSWILIRNGYIRMELMFSVF